MNHAGIREGRRGEGGRGGGGGREEGGGGEGGGRGGGGICRNYGAAAWGMLSLRYRPGGDVRTTEEHGNVTVGGMDRRRESRVACSAMSVFARTESHAHDRGACEHHNVSIVS